jgi:hypothetical protein
MRLLLRTRPCRPTHGASASGRRKTTAPGVRNLLQTDGMQPRRRCRLLYWRLGLARVPRFSSGNSVFLETLSAAFTSEIDAKKSSFIHDTVQSHFLDCDPGAKFTGRVSIEDGGLCLRHGQVVGDVIAKNNYPVLFLLFSFCAENVAGSRSRKLPN